MNFFNSIALLLYKQPVICEHDVNYENKSQNRIISNSISRYFVYMKNTKAINTKYYKYMSNNNLIAATDFIYYFNKINYSKMSLFGELINKYCQQTIFLSSVTPKMQSYCNKMMKIENQITKEYRKKRVFNFNKAVFNYRIIVNTLMQSYFYEKAPQRISLPIKYSWKKSINCPTIVYNLVKRNKSKNFQNFSISFAQILKTVNIPLFTITNNLSQFVIAEPSEAILMKNKMKNIIYRWYYYSLLSGQDQAGIYEGWFFVNPGDANEYKTYIESKYHRSYKQNGLNIFISGIHLYYRLNRVSAPRVQFRLFPDLAEVSNLVMNSNYHYNTEFDQKQNCGKNYFQGQPIYFIKPIIYRQKQEGEEKIIYCHYQISEDLSQKKYYPIFLNRKVALNTWQKFRQVMIKKNILLPKYPVLHVYNLEDFLKDNENNIYWIRHNFLLVPSPEVYSFIKFININNYNKSQGILKKLYNVISPYVLWSTLWSRRIICSLTNKQPPV
jgi:hypothetical protein|uniref:Ycf80 n=1 Tax=Thorea hispida TaxID=202687 RepID=A0A1C9CAE9_9FLOR|nr:hypothetical protein Thor_069 [Thorea hispida]AOM65361.1 hypothetical protein Thor_069 [Thorea hispida]